MPRHNAPVQRCALAQGGGQRSICTELCLSTTTRVGLSIPRLPICKQVFVCGGFDWRLLADRCRVTCSKKVVQADSIAFWHLLCAQRPFICKVQLELLMAC